MSQTPQPVPAGYHTVTPYLIVAGAASAIDFYQRAFGATEVMRLPGPDGRIGHAEIRIGDSPIMMADECPQLNHRSPLALGGAGISILLYVPNVDTMVEQAVSAGATVLRPLQNQFYGDRSATLKDPFGHLWTIATHVEDVPPDELTRRVQAYATGEQ